MGLFLAKIMPKFCIMLLQEHFRPYSDFVVVLQCDFVTICGFFSHFVLSLPKKSEGLLIVVTTKVTTAL